MQLRFFVWRTTFAVDWFPSVSYGPWSVRKHVNPIGHRKPVHFGTSTFVVHAITLVGVSETPPAERTALHSVSTNDSVPSAHNHTSPSSGEAWINSYRFVPVWGYGLESISRGYPDIRPFLTGSNGGWIMNREARTLLLPTRVDANQSESFSVLPIIYDRHFVRSGIVVPSPLFTPRLHKPRISKGRGKGGTRFCSRARGTQEWRYYSIREWLGVISEQYPTLRDSQNFPEFLNYLFIYFFLLQISRKSPLSELLVWRGFPWNFKARILKTAISSAGFTEPHCLFVILP